jgi:hypothetical protein
MLGAGLKAVPLPASNVALAKGASGIAAAIATGSTASPAFGDFSPV